MAKPSTSPSPISESVPPTQDAGAIRHLWLSPWTSWVGIRYLKSKKDSRFLSFITLISILGVGLGVTAMIIVLSVMDGFEAELKKRMRSNDLHILVQPRSALKVSLAGSLIPEEKIDESVVSKLRAASGLELDQVWPVLSAEAILRFQKRVKGIELKGFQENRLEEVKKVLIERFPEREKEHSSELPGIYIGQELAYEMRLLVGDEVTLVSPLDSEGPVDSVPRMKKYQVLGVYSTGQVEQELQTIYSSEKDARSFLRKKTGYSYWEMTVKNFDEAPLVAASIAPLLPEFEVSDWMKLNSHLFASLRLERLSMFIILAFIIVVASFNIVTTLTLMVLDKKKEIAILKAMGARNGQVASIFLSEGLMIGVLGVGGGAAFGLGFCLLLERYKFIELPEIYYDPTLPVSFQWHYYVIICVSALAIVLTACLYPSKRAAKITPLDGIRYGD